MMADMKERYTELIRISHDGHEVISIQRCSRDDRDRLHRTLLHNYEAGSRLSVDSSKDGLSITGPEVVLTIEGRTKQKNDQPH